MAPTSDPPQPPTGPTTPQRSRHEPCCRPPDTRTPRADESQTVSSCAPSWSPTAASQWPRRCRRTHGAANCRVPVDEVIQSSPNDTNHPTVPSSGRGPLPASEFHPDQTANNCRPITARATTHRELSRKQQERQGAIHRHLRDAETQVIGRAFWDGPLRRPKNATELRSR